MHGFIVLKYFLAEVLLQEVFVQFCALNFTLVKPVLTLQFTYLKYIIQWFSVYSQNCTAVATNRF